MSSELGDRSLRIAATEHVPYDQSVWRPLASVCWRPALTIKTQGLAAAGIS